MNAKNKLKWLLNALLFLGFILNFFLGLTGVIVHQWLGLVVGAIALFHLINHWEWVKAVISRFLRECANRSRLFFILDAALMLGLGLIILTGLIISTWVGLMGSAYEVWHRLHILNSMVTLGLLIAKLLLHWKVIANAFKKVFISQPVCMPSLIATIPVENASVISRRDALRVMGAVSLVGAIAMTKAGLGLSIATNTDNLTSQSNNQLPQPQVSTAIAQTTPQVNQVNNPAPTVTVAPVASQHASPCEYRCPRGNHCSFPGRCRLYTDNNNNGFCDLGECL